MIPALVQWELTTRCNFHCLHCYRLDESDHSAELDEAEMWQIAEKIVQNRLFLVTFTGGEPLLRRQLLLDLARFFQQNGLITSINTNLRLLDETLLADLAAQRLLISCPSVAPETYALITGGGNYQQFEARLKLVIAAQKSHTVNMVVSRLNRQDVRRTAEHLAKLGVQRFAATPVSLNVRCPRPDLLLSLAEVQVVLNDLIWVHEELGLAVDIMEAIPKCSIPVRAFELNLPFIHRSCQAGKRNGAISPLGEVRPCGHNPLTFGNLLQEDMPEVWKKMHPWREQSGNEHHDCVSCDAFATCGSGCRFGAPLVLEGNDARRSYLTALTVRVLPKPPEIQLSSDTLVRPGRSFQARPEGDGWLVASGSARDLMEVNVALYEFLRDTRGLSPTTLQQLAAKFQTTFSNPDFQRIMRQLIQKKFFIKLN